MTESHLAQKREPAQNPATETLQGQRYISLRSFKRDGGAVTVPVWCTPVGDRLVFMTDGNSVKVKRMQRNARVQVAGCNANGKKVHTDYFEGIAEIIDDPQRVAAGRCAVLAKYGWQMRMVEMTLRLRGIKSSVLIELDMDVLASPS